MITDFHSHVLPFVDDGSASVAESIAMLEMEKTQGVLRVVATPHFHPDREDPESFLAKRTQAERVLREEMAKHPGLPEITVGAEVPFCRGISEWDTLKDLRIGDSRCILIEMPMVPWTESMFRELEQIPEKQGLTPIIAHVDRYLRPFDNWDVLKRLEQLPVYVQANASAFLSGLSRRRMLACLRQGKVHLLGSDCHNLRSRSPNLGKAVAYIDRHLGTEVVNRICECEKFLLV